MVLRPPRSSVSHLIYSTFSKALFKSGLTDTLALGSAAPGPSQHSAQRRFHYGWLRGAGSAAFICGTLLSGQAISRFGITAAVWLNAGLLAATAVAARLVPVLLLPTKDGTRPHCHVTTSEAHGLQMSRIPPRAPFPNGIARGRRCRLRSKFAADSLLEGAGFEPSVSL